MNKHIDIHKQIPLFNRLFGSVIFVVQHIFKKSSLIEKARTRNVLKTLKSISQGETVEVTRVDYISKDDFKRNFLKKGIPLIFNREAINWECCQEWDLDYFRTEFENDTFSIIDTEGLSEKELLESTEGLIRKEFSGKEFIDSIREGSPLYIRFCPILETHPYLREKLNLSWLRKMKECFLGVSYQTFIGSKGRKTPLHSETTSFFYIMIEGNKRWNLYSPSALTLLNPAPEGKGYNFTGFTKEKPDSLKYPGADKLIHYSCVLEKGDILFVPTWMWHEVENITDSWGVSYRFTNLSGFLRYPSLAFIRFFLTKPNFLEVAYYSFFKNDLGKRKKNPLTPKLFLKEK